MLDPSEFDPAFRQIHVRLLTAIEVVFFTGAGPCGKLTRK